MTLAEPAYSDELVGIRDYDGHSPVILVASPADIAPIARNYPRAHVVSLPADCSMWTANDAWELYLPLLQRDVTIWPVTPADHALLTAIAPVLDVAGVRTLRFAHVGADPHRFDTLETVWKDRAGIR